jgi:hypothetical protein
MDSMILMKTQRELGSSPTKKKKEEEEESKKKKKKAQASITR